MPPPAGAGSVANALLGFCRPMGTANRISSRSQRRIELAGLVPGHDIERAHEPPYAHGLRAQHGELDDLLLAEVLPERIVDRVGVDRIVTRLEQVGVLERGFFPGRATLERTVEQ